MSDMRDEYDFSGGVRGKYAGPDLSPGTVANDVANIEIHIKTLLPAAYLESIGANIDAPSHKRQLHHRCMRIFDDLADRLAAPGTPKTCSHCAHYDANSSATEGVGYCTNPNGWNRARSMPPNEMCSKWALKTEGE